MALSDALDVRLRTMTVLVHLQFWLIVVPTLILYTGMTWFVWVMYLGPLFPLSIPFIVPGWWALLAMIHHYRFFCHADVEVGGLARGGVWAGGFITVFVTWTFRDSTRDAWWILPSLVLLWTCLATGIWWRRIYAQGFKTFRRFPEILE